MKPNRHGILKCSFMRAHQSPSVWTGKCSMFVPGPMAVVLGDWRRTLGSHQRLRWMVLVVKKLVWTLAEHGRIRHVVVTRGRDAVHHSHNTKMGRHNLGHRI